MKSSKLISLLSSIAISYACGATEIPNLFSDQRAIKVDDILTVQIIESAKANTQAKTNSDKEQSFGVQSAGGSGTLGIIPQFGASGGTKVTHAGQGATSREGSLVATISARVLKVLDNGNLVIEGSKVVEINDEKGIIKISGTVRPLDIQQNNVILSSSIADAQITYSGKGVVATSHRPGLILRILNWIF
jgi:flagellar L-ring protein precursor FlgH